MIKIDEEFSFVKDIYDDDNNNKAEERGTKNMTNNRHVFQRLGEEEIHIPGLGYFGSFGEFFKFYDENLEMMGDLYYNGATWGNEDFISLLREHFETVSVMTPGEVNDDDRWNDVTLLRHKESGNLYGLEATSDSWDQFETIDDPSLWYAYIPYTVTFYRSIKDGM